MKFTTTYVDTIHSDSFFSRIVQDHTLCFIDTEGWVIDPREFCFSLCEFDVATLSVKVTSLVITKSKTMTEDLQRTLDRLMSKYKNLLFVGFNTAYDLDVIQEWAKIKLKCQYIDIMPAFQQKFDSKCASLLRASVDYRQTMNKPMWDRYLKHSAYQDCLETLECFLFIAKEHELTVHKFDQLNQIQKIKTALKSCIDKILDELDEDINKLKNPEIKKIYLREMLWYIYTQYIRKQKIDSFKEIVTNTPSFMDHNNLRDYGIVFNTYLDKKNLTRICYPAEQDILISMYNMIFDINSNSIYSKVARQSFHQLYDTPDKQKNLRQKFESQDEAFLEKMQNMNVTPRNVNKLLDKSNLFLSCLLNHQTKPLQQENNKNEQ